MHGNEKNRYWKRIGMVALVMVMLVTGGTTALAQEDSEARKFTDPDDPLYAPHRDAWRAREQALAAREGLPEVADLVVRRHPDGLLDTRASPRR